MQKSPEFNGIDSDATSPSPELSNRKTNHHRAHELKGAVIREQLRNEEGAQELKKPWKCK